MTMLHIKNICLNSKCLFFFVPKEMPLGQREIGAMSCLKAMLAGVDSISHAFLQ